MKNTLALFTVLLCLIFTSCHRPVAYFQRTPYVSQRQPVADEKTTMTEDVPDSSTQASEPAEQAGTEPASDDAVVVSRENRPVAIHPINARVERRMRRAASILTPPAATAQPITQPHHKPDGPGPKPKKKMRLGNRIRESLGLPLREELTWWQRISWKLKASVIVILVAVLFAVLNLTTLAIIFGLIGAFLLVTGLKRSFKVRRPWF